MKLQNGVKSDYAKLGFNASLSENDTDPFYFNVPVTLESKRTWATVDSGCTASVVSLSLVRELSLPITKVNGSIRLAASGIEVPRIGIIKNINFVHNDFTVLHDFEVMDVNKDLAMVVIGTDLMGKVGLVIGGLATSWDTAVGPSKPDPILTEKLEPNESPVDLSERLIYIFYKETNNKTGSDSITNERCFIK
jgi:hypothetical protein